MFNKHAPRLIAHVKNHALANYENGWDIVIEAWDDEEIAETIGYATTEKGAVAKVWKELRPLVEFREEIRSTGF